MTGKNRNRKKQLFDKANRYLIIYLAVTFLVVIINLLRNKNYHQYNSLAFSEGVVKQSRVRSTMRWWAKCISMVIAKAASRNVAFKTDVMSQAVLEAQASFVTPQATDQEASSE